MTGRTRTMGKARRNVRRGRTRLIGAGVFGVVAAALPTFASATELWGRESSLWFVNINGQNFNVIQPLWHLICRGS
ncbi:MAG: hypothetical protein AB7I38_06885 [Dehalococcoidia bacterium]